MPNLSPKDKWLGRLTEALDQGSFVKLTLAGYRGRDAALRNVFVRPVELREGPRLSFVYRYASRDVTKNFPQDEAFALLSDLVGTQFRHAHLFSTQWTSELDFRDGRTARLLETKPVHTAPPTKAHDQAKLHGITPETSPWLAALGVATPDGKIAKGMEAKFRQINKFVEVLASLMKDAGLRCEAKATLSVADMGCGKGYLTFAAYDWFRKAGFTAQVRGIEARPELVQECNRIAGESRFDGLKFEAGTIATSALERVDVLIALHACDTATDDAIARGIKNSAALVVVSPCCHKEVRPQLVSPPVLAGALRHGILLERHAEFVTDALRAALLEWAGYDTKVFEFISTEHTAKNLMIAATKRIVSRGHLAPAFSPSGGEGAQRAGEGAAKVRELAAFYGIRSQKLASNLDFPLSPD